MWRWGLGGLLGEMWGSGDVVAVVLDDFGLVGVVAVLDEVAAGDEDVADGGGGGGEGEVGEEGVGCCADEGDVVEVDGGEVGVVAGLEGGGGEIEGAGAVVGGHGPEGVGGLWVVGGEDVAALEAEAFVVFGAAHFFEVVDVGVAVGAKRDGDVACGEFEGGEEAVAEVAFGGGAGADGGAGGLHEVEVVGGEVGGVDEGCGGV